MTHNLKTHPEPFQAIWDGRKTAELRLDDRCMEVGDLLMLEEYKAREAVPDRGFTGRHVLVEITYITKLFDWVPGCDPRWKMLSIKEVGRSQ